MQYLVANFKSHKTSVEVAQWVEAMKGIEVPDDLDVIVCPPFPYAFQVFGMLQEFEVEFVVGTQDVSPFPLGAYTGEVAAEQIAEFADYAIVGHSERRKYFDEDHQQVANKVRELLHVSVQPIVCVDEPYMKQQLAAIDEDFYQDLIVAYEPLEAIGSGKPDTPEHATAVAEEIREVAGEVPVLYGGSVTPMNIGGFIEEEALSGFLVGGASLDASKWQEMIGTYRN